MYTIAIGIGEVGTLGSLDKRRSAADRAKRAHGRIDSAGEKTLGALLECVRPCVGEFRGLRAHGAFSIEAARGSHGPVS